MKRLQAGFTIIELVVVIVILGILAATALPRFIDLGTDAKIAAAKGVAGAAASASTLNYSGCAVMNNVPTTDKCVVVDSCDDLEARLQGGVPVGFAIAASVAPTAATNGTQFTCTVETRKPGTTTRDTAIPYQDFPAIVAGK